MLTQETLANVALPLGPLQRNATTEEAEMCLVTAGTHVVIAVPTWMRGKICDFTAITTDCDVLFGTASTLDVEYGNSNSVDGTTKAVTTEATTGRRIVAGTTRDWLVPVSCTHIAFEAAGAGLLYIGRASQRLDR